MDLARQFDVVNCVGVLHHIDGPDLTVENLYKHIKAGGGIIIWVYSKESNFLTRAIFEPFGRPLLSRLQGDLAPSLLFKVQTCVFPSRRSIDCCSGDFPTTSISIAPAGSRPDGPH